MRGIVSFHPVDLRFFRDTLAPLVAGSARDLEGHLDQVVRARRARWRAGRYVRALESILASAQPKEPDPLIARPRSTRDLLRTSVELVRSPETLLRGIKARLDRFDHRLDEMQSVVLQKIDPDIHLFGRPFLITAASPSEVAETVEAFREAPVPAGVDNLVMEQLVALDPHLARVEPEDGPSLDADLSYRGEAYRELRSLARGGPGPRSHGPKGDPAWTAMRAHARIVPFWIARDVDGLATVCRSAEISVPEFLDSPLRLFDDAAGALCATERIPRREIEGSRDLGAYVPPDRVPDLLDFLVSRGSQILRAASRYGESRTASAVLRKIRECATYAARKGSGYLEASGIVPDGVFDADACHEETCAGEY